MLVEPAFQNDRRRFGIQRGIAAPAVASRRSFQLSLFGLPGGQPFVDGRHRQVEAIVQLAAEAQRGFGRGAGGIVGMARHADDQQVGPPFGDQPAYGVPVGLLSPGRNP